MTVSDSGRRWGGLQPLTWLVLLVIVGMTVAGTLVTRGVVRDQEQRLLKQRVEEAAYYLSSVLDSQLQLSLNSVVRSPDTTPSALAAFHLAALGAQKLANFHSISLVDVSGPTPTFLSVVGPDFKPGTALDATRAKAVKAAVASGTVFGTPFATTRAFTAGGKPHLGLAYAPPIAPKLAVYAEAQFDPFKRQQQATSGQPFHELIAEVYAGPARDRSQLLISSVPESQYPLTGLLAKYPVAVGAGEKWLIVGKARQSLVGSVALFTPWGILLGGLLTALLAAWTTESLGRRRRYALELVAERTAELETSLNDLSAAQRQLVRQERLAAIGELASTIGHEMRNPLGVLSNALYLLRADLGPAAADRSRRHLATADREVAAASLIVSDLLEFARAREPAPVEFDVGNLLDEVLAVSPPPSGVEVTRHEPAEPVSVAADRDQMRQVLLNLVGNAVQAMEEGGALGLRVEHLDGAVRLSVSDTGSGMADDVREQVFEPFFTTKARGVGLGLAVTRRIIEAHGGDIEVVSVPGEGSTFTVTLPRVAVQRQPAEALSPEVAS